MSNKTSKRNSSPKVSYLIFIPWIVAFVIAIVLIAYFNFSLKNAVIIGINSGIIVAFCLIATYFIVVKIDKKHG